MLPVNEVFETVQGEAFWTGTPAVFVRLQGCDVGCPWCDTKHTWDFQGPQVSLAEMAAKEQDAPSYAEAKLDDLVALVDGHASKHVVITGGEPTMHEQLGALCEALLSLGRTVQVETSGTRSLDLPAGVWVTISPKLNMPGGYEVMGQALARADELKMPVGKPADIETLQDLLANRPHPRHVWLQPLSQSKKATQLCLAAARDHGWRVSIQTHKFIGVR